MATVIGVRFRNAGKLYYFDPGALWPTAGDAVIVETVRGVEYGEVERASRLGCQAVGVRRAIRRGIVGGGLRG